MKKISLEMLQYFFNEKLKNYFALKTHTHTKSEISDLGELTSDDALTLLMEQGMIDPVSLNDGSILLDENNNILVL